MPSTENESSKRIWSHVFNTKIWCLLSAIHLSPYKRNTTCYQPITNIGAFRGVNNSLCFRDGSLLLSLWPVWWPLHLWPCCTAPGYLRGGSAVCDGPAGRHRSHWPPDQDWYSDGPGHRHRLTATRPCNVTWHRHGITARHSDNGTTSQQHIDLIHWRECWRQD